MTTNKVNIWRDYFYICLALLVTVSALFALTLVLLFDMRSKPSAAAIVSICQNEAYKVEGTLTKLDAYRICIERYAPTNNSIFDLTPTSNGLQP